jgi:hypothetical protein
MLLAWSGSQNICFATQTVVARPQVDLTSAKDRIEHMSAGLPPKADIAQRGWHGRKVPTGDITPFHSIISSARNRNDSGIVMPIALAVVTLITSSNFVGCSTGISPGFAPRRTLSFNREGVMSVCDAFSLTAASLQSYSHFAISCGRTLRHII